MDKNEYLFPEVLNSLLTSTINSQFIKKKPKIGITKELKNIKVDKTDGVIIENINLNKFLYTMEQCIELNNNNLISYKSLNPKNKLLYTDSNNEEEKSKINYPINYDFLLNIIQNDITSIEENIDGNNGKFIENFNEIESNEDIVFDSFFEEGNLRLAINLENKDLNEYDILMRKDYNNDKNYSWFYFSIKCKKEGNYKFNILNFIKKKIPFDNNTTVKVLSYNKNDKWTRNTYNVFYYPNSIPITSLQNNNSNNNSNNNINNNINLNNNNNSNNNINNNELNTLNNNSEDDEKDNEEDPSLNNNSNSTFYTLTFTYYVTKENLNIPIYFSYCFPYTYTTLQDYLYSLSINPLNKNKLKFSKLNRSISGNPLDLLYITNFNSSWKEIDNRPIVIFTSRVHPGETVGSYVIEGVINSLLDEKNNHLLKKYLFKIIPMLNPDGVINGCYRNNLLGKDLNRLWSEPRTNISPTIFYAKNLISINKTIFFCDFHGHSKMPNCALYGCTPKKKKVKGKIILIPQDTHKSYHWYEEKVFMKIFEDEAKYYQSSGTKYNISKSKLKTARAICYNEFQISFSYTLETSTMNVSEKNNIGDISNFNNVVYDGINIEKLYIIGSDFINSFVKWDNKNKFYAVLKKIRNDEEEKKMMKVKEKEEKEKEKEKEKEREKYYSNSPFKNLSLSNRSKKKTKKNISNIISDIRNINDNIKLQKNCNTVNTPKPKNNNNALFGKYNII